jgi:hypothetical protein
MPFAPDITPRSTQTQRPFAGLVNNVPRPRAQSSVDGFVRSRPAVQPPASSRPHIQATPRSVTPHFEAPQPQVEHRTTKKAAPQRQEARQQKSQRRLLNKLQLPAILLAATVAGLMLQSAAAGEALLATYAIFAFIRRVPSRITFTMAFLAVLSVIGLLAFKRDDILATNFTIYAFLLMAIGAITLSREMRGVRA